LKKLIAEISGLFRSSKDMLAGRKARELAAAHSRPQTSASRAAKAVNAEKDGRAGQDRRLHEELSPDIVALIASCGESVRKSDSVAPETPAPNSRKPATAG
jgi:hypothetical protein